jgi:DNA (cytosine-5)-methyltransferase 1
VDNSKELPTVLSFCTGYGGIERGLDLAGFEHRVVTHVEIEAFAAANLVAKMEEGQLVPAPIWTNLKTFPAHSFRDRIDLLTAGYPCQPFSAAGQRKGKDDPRHLWPYIYDHIRTIRPVRCFFENVEGHISLGLREVIEDLESLGYATSWGIFSAAEAGAPHQRKRVYILGDSMRKRSSPEWDEGGVKGRSWQSSANVADANSQRQSGWSQRDGRQTGAGSEGFAEKNVANANGSRFRQSDEKDARRPPEQFDGNGVQSANVSDTSNRGRRKISDAGQHAGVQEFSGTSATREAATIPNSDGAGLQRGLQRGSVDAEGRQEQAVRRPSECGDRRSGDGRSARAPFSELGRGFDGVATWLDGSWEMGVERVTNNQMHRIDRLRLLGNGVVPQTAAIAWTVLNKNVAG